MLSNKCDLSDITLIDIEVSNVAYEPPRRLRSKKKRIRKKWGKKYTVVMGKTIYHNCRLTGVDSL